LEFLLLLPLLPVYLLEKMIANLDSQWSWFPLAAARGIALCRENRPDLIYSTGGPASAHVAAGIVAARTGIPWIAEIQDPLVHGDWERGAVARKAYSFAERYVCARASRVVFVTREAMTRAAGRTALGDRGRFIYPGASSVPTGVRPEKGRRIRFVHLGSFGGSRNPGVLLEAAARLLRDRPELADSIRLEFYGSSDSTSGRIIREFPWKDVVVIHGRVSRMASLDAMQAADVLLLIQNVADYSAETIPSKVYEYLMARRPILALAHRNLELSAMLESLGHVCVEADDPASVRSAIETFFGERDRGALPEPAASPWSTEVAVDRLIAIAEPIAGIGKGNGRTTPGNSETSATGSGHGIKSGRT